MSESQHTSISLAAEHGLFVGAACSLVSAAMCVALWIGAVWAAVPLLAFVLLAMLVMFHRMRMRKGLLQAGIYTLWLMLFASTVSMTFTYLLILLVGSTPIMSRLGTLWPEMPPALCDARVVATLVSLAYFMAVTILLSPLASAVAALMQRRGRDSDRSRLSRTFRM